MRLRGMGLADLKQILMGLAAVGMAGASIANLFCAVAYGAVFLVRGPSDWVYLANSPLLFGVSVAVSVILAPLCAFFGFLLVTGPAHERRSIRELVLRSKARPRFEDRSHISKIEN